MIDLSKHSLNGGLSASHYLGVYMSIGHQEPNIKDWGIYTVRHFWASMATLLLHVSAGHFAELIFSGICAHKVFLGFKLKSWPRLT